MAPGPNSEPQWPPRSPREALLSTPSGRQRFQRALDRTSPSPSPSRTRRVPAPAPSAQVMADNALGNSDEDEDEETLQLKLQEIQARLRLKKLQNARNREASSPRIGSEASWSQPAEQSSEPRRRTRGTTPSMVNAPTESSSFNSVQVPASPVRKEPPPLPQTSPSRILLGIDKGLKAKDMSLKRAPNPKGINAPFKSHNPGYLERSRSTTLPVPTSLSPSSFEAPKSRSFNERLTSSRTEEAARLQRQERIQQVRTNAFGIGKQEMEEFKQRAVEIPDEPLARPASYTREQIMSNGRASAGHLTRSSTAPTFRPHPRTGSGESSSFSEKTCQESTTGDGEDAEKSSSFEPYSSFHLSRRILPHRVLARHVSGKKSMSIKELLRDVKAPDFSLPDVEQDIVVFGIVAKKSEPRAHKPSAHKKGGEDDERGKYMVMTVTDLDYELDLFLFNTGFTRFWKLTEGTVVAILNPTVMPPPPGRQDTGKFSLVINSDDDTILEIGVSRDLGSCQAIKKDGELCGSWVNRKRTQFCEFHSNEAIRKQRATRIEVNSSGFGGRERRQQRNGSKEWDGGKKGGPNNYDRETKTSWFATRSYSAADLIDGKDRALADRRERTENLKRSMEAKEKEREMMKKLGRVGSAAGKEYMLRAGQRSTNGVGDASSSSRATPSSSTEQVEKPTLASLGLQKGKERMIHLSPIKRKRPDSSQASSTTGSAKSHGFGWGSNLKDKLSRMKDGEELRRAGRSPVRKKTRFVTDKGIREAGRESLGVDLPAAHVSVDDGDEDDELIIVR
ncbi:hypothetical protein HIM_06017 [Hirsutella minnesotensis 3608]|uniref:Uncharacterized protein n=1 Tax=Hirsutella minnesotensis 3608 TaxID=1043627 RepID=A0A0F7ZZR2_9HYPO|nr:hypothetical protein HIM_06017 [Hirsutella minnesotensis 3608]